MCTSVELICQCQLMHWVKLVNMAGQHKTTSISSRLAIQHLSEMATASKASKLLPSTQWKLAQNACGRWEQLGSRLTYHQSEDQEKKSFQLLTGKRASLLGSLLMARHPQLRLLQLVSSFGMDLTSMASNGTTIQQPIHTSERWRAHHMLT